MMRMSRDRVGGGGIPRRRASGAAWALALLSALAPAALWSIEAAVDVETQVKLGQALRELDRDDEAIGAFRLALAGAPEDPTVRANLGSLLAEMGEYEEAVEHLQTAVGLDDEDVAARYELAEALRLADRWQEALDEYRAVLEREPAHENAHIGEADALVALSRYAEASVSLEAARQRFPDSRGLKFGQAWLLAASPTLELRDPSRALELARELYEARRSVGAVELVAAARAGVGNCEEAVELQRFVIEQARGFDQPAEVMARFERELGWYGSTPCSIPGARPAAERAEWPRNRSE